MSVIAVLVTLGWAALSITNHAKDVDDLEKAVGQLRAELSRVKAQKSDLEREMEACEEASAEPGEPLDEPELSPEEAAEKTDRLLSDLKRRHAEPAPDTTADEDPEAP